MWLKQKLHAKTQVVRRNIGVHEINTSPYRELFRTPSCSLNHKLHSEAYQLMTRRTTSDSAHMTNTFSHTFVQHLFSGPGSRLLVCAPMLSHKRCVTNGIAYESAFTACTPYHHVAHMVDAHSFIVSVQSSWTFTHLVVTPGQNTYNVCLGVT